jgi:hypothetical protein
MWTSPARARRGRGDEVKLGAQGFEERAEREQE